MSNVTHYDYDFGQNFIEDMFNRPKVSCESYHLVLYKRKRPMQKMHRVFS